MNTPPENEMAGAAPKKKNIESATNKNFLFWSDSASSFMGPGVVNPVLQTNACNVKDTFRIVLIKHDPSTNPDAASVALEFTNEKGGKSYISCRRSCPWTKRCLAEYRSEIGQFETFTMSYCKKDNTFFFQSHSNHFLHYSKRFHTVEFARCHERASDGFPKQGRWTLLYMNEGNRIGTKDAYAAISAEIVLAPIKGTVQLVKFVLFLG
mmetsp:Transcript_6813/g.9760  ORF Transcript_6813/g.9760 Transcript_6813/m.9760 type:complete len:209 (+) Transcript_6813:145-771(+)